MSVYILDPDLEWSGQQIDAGREEARRELSQLHQALMELEAQLARREELGQEIQRPGAGLG